MTRKNAPTQKQRKARYPAHINVAPVRVIGRNKSTGKLWVKERDMSTRLVDELEVTL